MFPERDWDNLVRSICNTLSVIRGARGLNNFRRYFRKNRADDVHTGHARVHAPEVTF